MTGFIIPKKICHKVVIFIKIYKGILNKECKKCKENYFRKVKYGNELNLKLFYLDY